MTDRETLLAEIAEKQARLAELDAEPDWEAWRPALQAYCLTLWGESYKITDTLDRADKERIRGLIAAFAKAPPMGEHRHEWQYSGTDPHGSHKGEDAYRCTKCHETEYRT
jgi:hypothetical protein